MFDENQIIIFRDNAPKINLLKMPTLRSIMPREYGIELIDDVFYINRAHAWQYIEKYNTQTASYIDTSEGIWELNDEVLEEIGWHGVDFDITYRQITDVIETECDVFMLCNEIDAQQYFFSGLGYIKDIQCARAKAKDFVSSKIKEYIDEFGDSLSPSKISSTALAFLSNKEVTK